MIHKIMEDLKKKATKQAAEWKSDYLQNKEGLYGEGDSFLGITVPETRKVAKIYYKEISLNEIKQLLISPLHEVRLIALLFLIYKYEKFNTFSEKKEILDVVLAHTVFINNWDLVDTCAPPIIGAFSYEFDKQNLSILLNLAKSTFIWEKRMSIVATQYFIRQKDFTATYLIAPLLFNDPHDLIKKGVGWMLKETGEKDKNSLLEFLKANHKEMNKPTLRFACEKLKKEEKALFINR